jgi:tRNA A-37 threonylcarbamoyl transferase component Bud32
LSPLEPTPFGDKYVLVEHIATGGMAEIYRANYTGIEGFAKELVVKRLREEFERRRDVVRMFLDEARVAATLTHNNVVHTYDLGEIAGEYFIAMELLKGQELVAVLRRAGTAEHKLPRDLVLHVVMQSLEGLHYVHSRADEAGRPLGLVHRDINPTNIHVGYDGVVKIVDFGIAATRATALAQSGKVAGKLGYMAPEQVRGEPVDRRADIFALGVVLYEMCVGRRLFRGAGEAVKRRILEGDIPAPTFIDPAFPPALEAVIMRALEVDPSDRYQNCDHMFRDLEAFVHDAGLTATPRKLSAFMARTFGEGAPDEVDYDDQYDDLDAARLDFEGYEQLARAHAADDEAEPDWVRSVDGGPAAGRRSLTIGNLEALVDTLGTGDPDLASAAESGVRRQLDPNRASGRHKMVAAPAEEAPAAASSATRRAQPRARAAAPAAAAAPAPAPRMTRRTAALSTAPDSGLSSSAFGQSVMTQQGKKGSAIIWLAALVAIGLLGYIAYTVLTSK